MSPSPPASANHLPRVAWLGFDPYLVDEMTAAGDRTVKITLTLTPLRISDEYQASYVLADQADGSSRPSAAQNVRSRSRRETASSAHSCRHVPR